MNQKISKIINNPNKYNIVDGKFTSCLKNLLQNFIKIESLFNSILFKNFKNNASILNLNSDSNRESNAVFSEREPVNRIVENIEDPEITTKKDHTEISLSVTADVINMDSYRSAQLSDYFKNLNTGNLVPLQSGHNGVYNQTEMEVFGLYLLNSKFIY